MVTSIGKQLYSWAERLRDISAYGLTFCKNPYDLENYQKIQDIAVEMTAMITQQEVGSFEAVRKTIVGRPTPLVVVDAAIFNEYNECLLIQRTDNKEWAFPGGYLDVGETAPVGVVREVNEEVGIIVDPIRLVGIYDSRRLRNAPLNQVITILFLCRPLCYEAVLSNFKNPVEVLDQKWYSKDELLQLDIDPCINLRIEHAFQALETDFHSCFDT